MKRLSLCMIWLSVFQHIAIADPHTPPHLRFEKEKEEDVGAPIQDWFHSFLYEMKMKRRLVYYQSSW